MFESFQNLLLYWKINLAGTINLLETMIKYKCKDLVFSSSETIYKHKDNCLFDEKSKLSPLILMAIQN